MLFQKKTIDEYKDFLKEQEIAKIDIEGMKKTYQRIGKILWL